MCNVRLFDKVCNVHTLKKIYQQKRHVFKPTQNQTKSLINVVDNSKIQ